MKFSTDCNMRWAQKQSISSKTRSWRLIPLCDMVSDCCVMLFCSILLEPYFIYYVYLFIQSFIYLFSIHLIYLKPILKKKLKSWRLIPLCDMVSDCCAMLVCSILLEPYFCRTELMNYLFIQLFIYLFSICDMHIWCPIVVRCWSAPFYWSHISVGLDYQRSCTWDRLNRPIQTVEHQIARTHKLFIHLLIYLFIQLFIYSFIYLRPTK